MVIGYYFHKAILHSAVIIPFRSDHFISTFFPWRIIHRYFGFDVDILDLKNYCNIFVRNIILVIFSVNMCFIHMTFIFLYFFFSFIFVPFSKLVFLTVAVFFWYFQSFVMY